jgi:hypothetical protein
VATHGALDLPRAHTLTLVAPEKRSDPDPAAPASGGAP